MEPEESRSESPEQPPQRQAGAGAKELKEGIAVGYATWLPWIVGSLAWGILLLLSFVCFLLGLDVGSGDEWFLLGSSRRIYAVVPVIVPVLALLVGFFFPARLSPRAGLLGVSPASKHYRREQKKRGVRLILKKRGLAWRWVVATILWVALIGVLINNYTDINDANLSLKPVFYVLAICAGVGLVAQLLLWPFSPRGQRVQVDGDGNVFIKK